MRWRNVHIGIAGDHVAIGGMRVWGAKWRPVCERVELPHPTHLAQIHDYDVYEIGLQAAAVRFAAGELSNGVWGFYVPDSSPPQAT